MLYDILFIDDDFGEKGDSSSWENDAKKTFFDLLRDNLRVTYTTGELQDLKQIKEKDLSCIKFVFCDLYLEGISSNANDKTVANKLNGVFGRIDQEIKSQKVVVFINSKYPREKWDSINKHLQVNRDKYEFKCLENKNILSQSDKDDLKKENLYVYLKQLILDKAIEVEKVFNQKLRLSNTPKEKLSFESKFLVFQSQFMERNEEHKKLKQQIKLLQEVRNKLAHTENDLSGIKGDRRKCFWELIEEKEGCESPITFKDFDVLIRYIQSIDNLRSSIEGLAENTK